jgi:hypothetical protein
MVPTYCILYRAKQVVVGGCQIWTVSRTGKNGPYHFCVALPVRKLVWGRALSWRRRTSFMFRLGRTLRMRYLSLCKVFLYRSWCAPKSWQEILQQWCTASYPTLAKVCWKWRRLCGKNSPIIAKYVWSIHVNFIGTAITLSEKKWRHYFCTAPKPFSVPLK